MSSMKRTCSDCHFLRNTIVHHSGTVLPNQEVTTSLRRKLKDNEFNQFKSSVVLYECDRGFWTEKEGGKALNDRQKTICQKNRWFGCDYLKYDPDMSLQAAIKKAYRKNKNWEWVKYGLIGAIITGLIITVINNFLVPILKEIL